MRGEGGERIPKETSGWRSGGRGGREGGREGLGSGRQKTNE